MDVPLPLCHTEMTQTFFYCHHDHIIYLKKVEKFEDGVLNPGSNRVIPTTEGVLILWVGGGEASEAPPKKSMMEWANTPC